VRRELRDVQRDLRQDIEAVQTFTKAVNIGAVPALVALLAIGLGLARLRRRSN